MSSHGVNSTARNVERPTSARRGVAVLVVLLLLSLTLALSYAAMRTQGVAARIQKNADRRWLARQDAINGLALAIKRMHRSDWAGVDTSLTGSLGTNDGYTVQFTTGDPSLTASSAAYQEYPFRVTLLSTGTSTDPVNPQNVATYSIRAVVRLVPRKLSDEPTEWLNMLKYTAYQWTSGDWSMTVPSRVEGPIYIQGAMGMSRELSWDSDPRTRFYADLNPMRVAYGADQRPYNAQVSLCYWQQYYDTNNILASLGVTTKDIGSPRTVAWQFPDQVATYRLYPGGKAYTSVAVDASLQNVTLQANVLTNPLGIFYRAGAIDIGDNVTIQGTLLNTYSARGDVTVRGKSVALSAVLLPAVYGTTQAVQLPALISADDVWVTSSASLAVTGLMAAYDTLDVASGPQANAAIAVVGEVVAGTLRIHNRNEWGKDNWWWGTKYLAFKSQLGMIGQIKYFPEYLQKREGLDPTPRMVFKPNPTSVRYHWHNWNNPIYVADPADGGLRWDLLEWKENP